MSALGEAPTEGSTEELQKLNLIPPFVRQESPTGHNQKNANQDLREPNATILVDAPRASDSGNLNMSTVKGDRAVLAYYMNSLGGLNMLIFWVFGLLCAGTYKVSGNVKFSSYLHSTNLSRLLGSAVE